jgi:L-ascorbate metabolism protein UlaG (beta-lactamase superfamily)
MNEYVAQASAKGIEGDLLRGVRLLTHASLRLESDAGMVVYVDPYQVEGAPHDGDYVLVTHDHYDHYSPEDIAKVAGEDCQVVVPETLAQQALELGLGEPVVCAPGDALELQKGFRLEAVAAYNMAKHFHPKERAWVGYVVELDGKRVFHMGDTDQNPENEQVACDVLCIPVGGTFTMDVDEAVPCALRIAPKLAIPMHYGSVAGDAACGERFCQQLAEASGGTIASAVLMEY